MTPLLPHFQDDVIYINGLYEIGNRMGKKYVVIDIFTFKYIIVVVDIDV